MNFMSSSSFKKYMNLKQQAPADSMEVGSFSTGAGGNAASELDRFIHHVEAIKDDVKIMEKLQNRLHECNEDSKNIRDASTMKELRAIMDSEVDHILILAKAIMKRVEGLERGGTNNGVERKLSGQVSSLDRTRMSVVAGLGKKMKDMMDEFQGLRAKMAATYKETIEYKYLLLTGEKECIETIERLISTGEIEQFLFEAVEEQGRDGVFEILEEIHERREGAKYMQKNLIDLQQLLLDMVSFVEAQGQKMNHEQPQMQPGNSFIRPGAAQLQDSWDHEKDAKKRGTIALILIVVLIVILIFPLFQFESEVGNE